MLSFFLFAIMLSRNIVMNQKKVLWYVNLFTFIFNQARMSFFEIILFDVDAF